MIEPVIHSSDRPSALVQRPAAERFHTRFDWLDSRHSFSFGHHHDPAWLGHGPLRVINDDTIAPGRGFGLHPHHDMEIITVIVSGQIDHGDSMGNRQILRSHEVQRMSAGSGLLHSEINGGAIPTRLLQIWIEPSRRGLPPGYDQRPFELGPHWRCLVAPDGAAGALTIAAPVRLWRARPMAAGVLSLPLSAGCGGWIQMISGEVELALAPTAGPGDGGSRLGLGPGDGLGFPAAALRQLSAGPAGADLLLFELPAA